MEAVEHHIPKAFDNSPALHRDLSADSDGAHNCVRCSPIIRSGLKLKLLVLPVLEASFPL